MANARFLAALSRIESAAARLESLATRPGAHPGSAGTDAELAARHEKLRAGTAEALARLDRLIATQPEA